LAEEQLIEPPAVSTAGLASGLQLVDSTGFQVFMPTQSTSVAPDLVALPIFPKLATRDMMRAPAREVRLERALRESLRENSEILRELARY